MTGTFGVRGEVKVEPTRIGAGAFASGLEVHVDGSTEGRTLRIDAVRMHKGRPLLTFAAIGDTDTAQALVGARITLARDDVRLADGEYLDDDLLGCTLVNAEGMTVGDVVAVEHYPASDMLVVGEKRAMIPLVRDFVRAVDVERRRITVDLPPGLLDDRLAERDSS